MKFGPMELCKDGEWVKADDHYEYADELIDEISDQHLFFSGLLKQVDDENSSLTFWLTVLTAQFVVTSIVIMLLVSDVI
jgi:hypothetical protein